MARYPTHPPEVLGRAGRIALLVSLLLIMGLGLPGAAWLASLPFLTQFKCIYFDNRGTGNSDKPEGPYTIPQLADDAGNLLDSFGIHKAKVYGFSMGGMIAQELTLRHPLRFKSWCSVARRREALWP